jgi:glycosyltransferase involved in cell wall biosynthesis
MNRIYQNTKEKRAKIVLLHQDKILHYRVSIYNYFFKSFKKNNYDFSIISNGIDRHNPHPIGFTHYDIELGTKSILGLLKTIRPDIVIFFVNLKNIYLFPVLFWCKIRKIKTVYWGHAIDLGDKQSKVKNFFYSLEHSLVDALILYAPHLLQYVKPKRHSKCFIANNTLNLFDRDIPDVDPQEVKKKYKITTNKNVVYVGRIQNRKGLDLLLDALALIKDDSVGLVLVGPNHDCDVDFKRYKNVYQLGPLFGKDLAEVLLTMDVCCIPKWVGLSIVEAFYFGLPLVTTDVAHPPEIMYLRNGINGFIVPDGDIPAMAERLSALLTDDELRKRMGEAARREILENATIEKMFEGFRKAVAHCVGQEHRLYG